MLPHQHEPSASVGAGGRVAGRAGLRRRPADHLTAGLLPAHAATKAAAVLSESPRGRGISPRALPWRGGQGWHRFWGAHSGATT